MKIKQKSLKIASIVMTVASVAVISVGCAGAGVTMVSDTYELEKKDLKVTVSVEGTVESRNVKNIYSNLGYPVKEIKVKLGDRVKAGDVLCILDSSDLESQIAVQEAQLQNSNTAAYFNASESEKAYNEAKFNYDNGLNIELNAAETSLKNAEIELNDLKKQYNNKQNNLTEDESQALINAKVQVKNAEIDKRTTLKKYNDAMAKAPLQADIIKEYDKEYKNAGAELKAAERNLKNAQGKDAETLGNAADRLNKAKQRYEDASRKLMDAYTDIDCKYARINYENSIVAYDTATERLETLTASANADVSQLEKMVNNAQNVYDNAKKTYEATKSNIEKQLKSLEINMQKDKTLVANQPAVVELVNLRSRLESCMVKATQDGVITSVTAVEGQSAMGILFVIQDDKNLQITSDINEMDIDKVKGSVTATIKSFVTGDKEFNGTLSHVSPVAEISQKGNVFPVIIDVKDRDAGLLIGTGARIKIISDEKDDIFAVTFDSIKTKENGENVIYIGEPMGKDGMYKAKEIIVETGIETDYEIEVISDELQEGMVILSNIENLENGAVVMTMK